MASATAAKANAKAKPQTPQSCCSTCGQEHENYEPHLYDYAQEVDDDLTCQICLQPLVDPVDLSCGHTFCAPCAQRHLLLRPLCPVDRSRATVSDAAQSSLVLNKVLGKLKVKCPPKFNCGEVVQRVYLEDHIKYRCPVLLKRMFDPLAPKPRVITHHSKGITRLPVLEGEVSHIEIPRLSPGLGIAIVGGSDTALRCIVVQEVFAEGLVAQDGRLRPGDQLVEINGADMSNATHHEACNELRKNKSQVLRLGVYRERIAPYNGQGDPQPVTISVTIKREPNQQLGIILSGCTPTEEKGLFITEVVRGSPADHVNSLRPNDQILCINDQDVHDWQLQRVSAFLQRNERVTLVVSRKRNAQQVNHSRTKSAPELLDSPVAEASGLGRRGRSASYESLLLTSPSLSARPTDSATVLNQRFRDHNLKYKSIVIKKHTKESLGMRIAGGVGSNEGDIPIYIANIHSEGCVAKTKNVMKGDILVGVNGSSLLGLTHVQAVALLKATVQTTRVEMTLADGPETTPGTYNFVPSWLYWQKLPRGLQIPKTVVLFRAPGASLGFSIVGGEEPGRGPQHIHVLFVVQDSPAANHGKLRCGDRLLAVDGQSLEKVEHSKAVTMLKQTGSKVVLVVVSWLGTEL